ncbi:MAG: hypothetical protein EBY17_20915 [Acidobacteriia bacterium]|nr:hypothetical protein [Terriglobia bacterium]
MSRSFVSLSAVIQDANLLDANLLDANLLDANLLDANLLDANLLDANNAGHFTSVATKQATRLIPGWAAATERATARSIQ